MQSSLLAMANPPSTSQEGVVDVELLEQTCGR